MENHSLAQTPNVTGDILQGSIEYSSKIRSGSRLMKLVSLDCIDKHHVVERAYCPWKSAEGKVVVNNRKLSETVSLIEEQERERFVCIPGSKEEEGKLSVSQ